MITKPTIHLNGTGAAGLVAQYRTARQALETGLEALRKASPHGRDYYPQDSGEVCGPAYRQARDEHERRCDAIRQTIGELLALELHCHDLSPAHQREDD